MPRYEFLKHDLVCECGSIVSGTVFFQWGYCSRRAYYNDPTYQIGDLIRWRKARDGSIPAWTYFPDVSGNIGDSSCENLVVTFPAEGWDYGYRCTECRRAIAGSAVRIEAGRIVGAWLFYPGDLLDQENVDVFLSEGGTLIPRPEWYDHPMPIRDI